MRFRSIVLGAALAVLAMLVGLGILARAPHGAPVSAASSTAITVTFFNCGAAYPCEKIENHSDAAVQVTLQNTYQHQIVTVPAHQSIVVELDASDNR